MAEERLPADVREALHGQLALLIERAGWEPFVCAPLIPPAPEAFAEKWLPNARGVGTVARRLLAYAGLPAARVRVTDYSALAEERTVSDADVSFSGLDADRSVVIELRCCGEEHDLLGAMCHVVGGAWLALQQRELGGGHPFRGVVEVDGGGDGDEMAEARASVAAVYLGFGIPATNAAHSARHGGYFTGSVAVTEWAVTMAGGLSVYEMVYLLAVQLTVRDRDDEIQLARRELQTNQRADLNAWLKLLACQRDALRQRLGLPEPSAWPDPAPLDPTPLTGGEVVIDVPVDREQARQFNRGRNIFRVRLRRTGPGAGLGGLIGLLIGVLAFRLALFPALASLVVGIGSVIAGGFIGRRLPYWVCSDAECRQRISPNDTTCQVCGGTVAGELLDANDRLDAEEAIDADS